MKWLHKSLPIVLFLTLALPAGALLYVNHATDQTNLLEHEGKQTNDKNNNPAEESKVEEYVSTPRISPQSREGIPDFSAYVDVRQKKKAFFEFMLPLIRKANTSIRQERIELEQIIARMDQSETLTSDEYKKLSNLFREYRIKAPLEVQAADVEALLERVDIVPASLILAQAANESGWGTSRFATEANNYFGVWCFTAGCGVEPRNRDDGMTHEVALYSSVQNGVGAYIHNINTHGAYEALRMIRAEQRYSQNHYMGLQLADGLMQYSARGEDYILEIQQMIRSNNLHEYTLPTPTSA